MTATPNASPVRDWQWRNPKGDGGFRLRVYPGERAVITADGTGSMDGARAIIDHVDRALAELDSDAPYRVLIAMADVHSSPVRGQFLLGKWLFKKRHALDRLAVLGARPWERKLAAVVIKLSGLASKVRLFGQMDAACDYLAWTPPAPPDEND